MFLTQAPSPHFLQEKLQPGDPLQRTGINSRERGRVSAASKAAPSPDEEGEEEQKRQARRCARLGMCVASFDPQEGFSG